MKLTHRRLASAPEIRSSEDPSKKGNRLAGYAALFGCESEILYDASVIADEEGNPLPFIEILDVAVFDRTLREMPDVRALYNHDTSAVLGRTKSGTLRLSKDTLGLGFEDDLPNTIDGERARELVGRGDIDGCSFGFQAVEDELIERPGLPALRTLFDVDLYEISIAVAFPAYTATSVALRTRNRGMTPRPTPRLDLRRRYLRVGGF